MKRFVKRIWIFILYVFGAILIYYLLPVPVNYRIIQKYDFGEVPVGQTIRLGLILPKSNEFQHIGDLKIDWDGTYRRSDRGECAFLYMEANSKDGREYIAEIRYKVSLKQGRLSYSDDVKNEDQKAKPFIEAGDPAFQQVADSIFEIDAPRDFFDIYTFVQNNIKQYDPEIISGLSSLDLQKGSSISSAHMATALARAGRMPCRQVTGRRFPAGMILIPVKGIDYPGNLRAWCEYYEDARWYFCDPLRVSLFPERGFNRSDGSYLGFASYNSIMAYKEQMESWSGAVGYSIKTLDNSPFSSAGATYELKTVPSEYKLSKLLDFRWVLIIMFFFVFEFSSSIKRIKKLNLERKKSLEELKDAVRDSKNEKT